MLGFYMDDSSDAERKTVFSVAGFIGEGKDWFDVERRWSARLAREGLDSSEPTIASIFKVSSSGNL